MRDDPAGEPGSDLAPIPPPDPSPDQAVVLLRTGGDDEHERSLHSVHLEVAADRRESHPEVPWRPGLLVVVAARPADPCGSEKSTGGHHTDRSRDQSPPPSVPPPATSEAEREPDGSPQPNPGEEQGRGRAVQEAFVRIAEADVEAEHPGQGQQPHDDRASEWHVWEAAPVRVQDRGEPQQNERNELEHLDARHLLEGGIQKILGRVGGDVKRVSEGPRRTPQPEPPGKVAGRGPGAGGCQDPSFRSDRFPDRTSQHGPESHSGGEGRDEDPPRRGVREQHQERAQEDGHPGGPSFAGVGKEPQGRDPEQQREEVVDVAHEWAEVESGGRDDGHGTEEQRASAQAISHRRQRQDQEHLPARHEHRGQRVPVHIAHPENQRAEKGCGHSVAAPEDAERAVGEHQLARWMTREHLGPPRVPGHVGTGSEPAGVGHKGPEPRKGHPRSDQQDRQHFPGREGGRAPRRHPGPFMGSRARSECSHRLTRPTGRPRRRLGGEGAPR